MRVVLALASILLLAACASQSAPPEKVAVASAARHVPQCYSGDHGRFFNVEETTTISGVAVTCKPTSDGKAASWMGSKH
ncbi:hypothetical protein [Sulfuritalea sp.]|uniref:hypothetical protein n=1 Tax=Sulfuritalea sp. TaxID=2480090 RepID=UPI00286DB8FD|nr:hypothetical protein [Sulfuritalea sp.]